MNKVSDVKGNKLDNKPANSSGSGKKSAFLYIFITIVTLVMLFVIGLGWYKNHQLKQAVTELQTSYNAIANQKQRNECNIQNAICIYGKTSAVDDYLSIVSGTLKIQPNTSYDIMIEIVPAKLAMKENPINTDCRPNNHYLYICQRMTSSTPQKLMEQLIPAYDVLNPNSEYQVALILVPRVHLISDQNAPQAPVENQPTEPVGIGESKTLNTQQAEQQQEGSQNNINGEGQPAQEQQQPVQSTLDESANAPPNTFGQQAQ